MSEGNPSGMRPEMGDAYITLPITFDYSGGRRDSQKTKRGWAIIPVSYTHLTLPTKA